MSTRGRGRAMPPPRPEPETDSDEEISDEEEFDLVEEMNGMDVDARRKVYAVKGLTNEYRALRAKFFEEMAALELEELAKSNAIAAERQKIVSGERDPTEEEVKKGADILAAAAAAAKIEEIPSDDEEEPKKKKGVSVVTPAEKTAAEEAESKGGIPRFWLTAMKNSEVLDSMITERDEKALIALNNVTLSYLEDNYRKGFEIKFFFGENEFFENDVLTKTFFFEEDDDAADDDQTLDKAVGCEIDWKTPEKNLTVVIKQKKQRHKSGKGIRVVNKEEQVPSFFNFFRTAEEPESDDEDEDAVEMFEEQMQMDFEAGMSLKTGILQRPAFYYTGKSVEDIAKKLQEQFGFGLEDDDDEEDEDTEEDEESEDDTPAPARGRGRGGAGRGAAGGQQKECKQQ